MRHRTIVAIIFLRVMVPSAMCCVVIGGSAVGRQLITSVNPFIGTDGHGHTFPGATVPFGMVQLSPDTRVAGWDACAGYHYSDSTILGFSHTHLSGTGVADYGDILVVPKVGAISFTSKDGSNSVLNIHSRFRHDREKASPGYYSVQLEDDAIFAELTASRRVGVHRYTFPKTDSAGIIVDLRHGLGPDEVIESEIQIVGNREVAGWRRSKGWAKDQHIYFAMRFSKPFASYAIVLNDHPLRRQRLSLGKNLKGYVRFSVRERESIVVKVGISGVSVAGARKNLNREVPGWDFDEVRRNAERMWNQELAKIEIEGGTVEQRTTFYTALYHSMIAPNLFSDVDGSYLGMDRKIHIARGFDMHTVFSLWDTFRAEHPLFTIIDQKRTVDFIKSLLAKYDEAGTLPVWELAANETWCMIGYHSIPVIVDAFVKGIRGFDAQHALAAMQHSATADRYGLQSYKRFGFVQGEEESESVSKTLEYAYDDWCIAQMAQALGKKSVADEYSRRAQYFRNVFDPETHFMRPKINGAWLEPFDPTSVTSHYTEANPWQYSFFAPQDIDGLIGLFGGNQRFILKLDSLFNGSSMLAGRQQADISGMIGQYAHGNEPSHHVAYLYDYAGAPWKTQQFVRTIMDSLYRGTPAGLCGNDDCGQMSAWYVMSALGLYQVCPGQPMYCIGSPLFPKATIHLENGKKFVISAADNSSWTKFIQSATLNGTKYDKAYLSHETLMEGGELYVVMGSEPNPRWGSDETPHSLPASKIVTTPFIRSGDRQFRDSTKIEIFCPTTGAVIRYTLDGTEPTSNSSVYSSPLVIKPSSTLNAIASRMGAADSKMLSAEFRRIKPVGTIKLSSRYDDQYTGGGEDALIDGLRGKKDFRLGAWQGYHQVDLDAVIDLGEIKALKSVAVGCLQDIASWIFFPTSIDVSFSTNGRLFGENVKIAGPIATKQTDVRVREFNSKLTGVHARYVHVHAANLGLCPSWHPGAGEKAWLFVDEISVSTK